MYRPSYVSNCAHPIKIYVNGESKYVPCGKCPGCLRLKSSKNVDAFQLFYNSHKEYHLYFITLTYNDDNLPFADICYNTQLQYIVGNKLSSEAFKDDQLKPQRFYMPREKIEWSVSKTNQGYKKEPLNHLNDFYYRVPVLSKRDLQLFQKRLISAYQYESNKFENFKMFSVGEYGPVHFRPHYHIALFSKDDIFLWLQQNLPTLWPYGFNLAKRADVGTSKYLAQYVCCTSGLPAYLANTSFKPFLFHSTGFFKAINDDDKEALRGHWFERFDGFNLVVDGEIKHLLHPDAYINRLFPKVTGYDPRNLEKTFHMYTIYKDCRSRFGDLKPIQLCRKLVYDKCLLKGLCHFEVFHQWDMDKLLRLMYTSKRFYNNCIELYGSTELYAMKLYFDSIVAFYNRKSMLTLSKWYFDQQQTMQLCIDGIVTIEEVPFMIANMYNNAYPDLGTKLDRKSVPVYWTYQRESTNRYRLMGNLRDDKRGHYVAHDVDYQISRDAIIHPYHIHFWSAFFDNYVPIFNVLLPDVGLLPEEFTYRSVQWQMLYEDVKHKKLNDINRLMLA